MGTRDPLKGHSSSSSGIMSQFSVASSMLTTSSLLSQSKPQKTFSAGLLGQTSNANQKKILSDSEKLKLLQKEMKDLKKQQKLRKVAWRDQAEEKLPVSTKSTTMKSGGKVSNPLLSSTNSSTSMFSSSSLTSSSLIKPQSRSVLTMPSTLNKSRSRSRSKSPGRDRKAVKCQVKSGAVVKETKSPSLMMTKTPSVKFSTQSTGSLGGSLGSSLGKGLASSSTRSSLLHSQQPSSLLVRQEKSAAKPGLGFSSLTSSSGLKLTLTGGSGIFGGLSGLTRQTSLQNKSLLGSGSALLGGLSSSRTSHIGSHTSSAMTSLLSTKKASSAKPVKQSTLGLSGIETQSLLTDMKEPQYTLPSTDNVREIKIAAFVPPENDASIMRLQVPLEDVQAIKRGLINAVSASLIRAPDFKERKDPVRLDLLAVVERVANYDAEFVLKVALYTRNELNIRTTANFLLATASNLHQCRPYLKKYYKSSIRLPSDWIDVAEQYQAFHDKNLNFGALPAALRRVMAVKFSDFDKYQLAKYNKENAAKKKLKKARKAAEADGTAGDRGGHRGRGRGGGGRGRGRGRGGAAPPGRRQLESDSSSSDSDSSDSEEENRKIRKQISALSEQSETEEELVRLSFTLKQLIRKLHITQPVEHVMCLIGKKYPATREDFYKSGLPDTFDEERAGKRMKLPTPETWETQVSLKGNKATTWQDLIDHKKLPFMAMLRNLRNMIKAGISQKHHAWVLKKLTDEGAVVNSRQFPFRFFSAYEVLTQLERDYESNQAAIIQAAVDKESGVPAPAPRGRGRGRGARGARGGGRGRGRGGRGGGAVKLGADGLPEEVPYDVAILKRYRKALDQAVKIATLNNVKPIRGNTLIYVNMGGSMNVPCTSARGLGAPRTVLEVAVLLGLMCKYSCEESKLIVYGEDSDVEVELEKGTILNNMESVLALGGVVGQFTMEPASLPESYFTDILTARTQIDNLIILSNGMQHDSAEGQRVTDFLRKFRRVVNPNLLFVSVDLSAKSSGLANDIQPGHDNDIYLSGYSDQILRFIAERGDSGQLIHVDNIDAAYSLKAAPLGQAEKKVEPTVASVQSTSVEKPLPIVSLAPRWRTARVFISSTFRDMHGERDLLTRFVFPELRARAAKMCVNVYEVDLRWGVTEETARTNNTLELCLTEVSRCQFFIGLLGERYGWVPQPQQIPTAPEFDWVRDYTWPGASVTEMEMHSGGLSNPAQARGRSFFYLRDSNKLEVPKRCKEDFLAEDQHASERMAKLKERIRTSGIEVYNGYSSHWGGVLAGKPMAAGLDRLGERILGNLWNAIQKDYDTADQNTVIDEWVDLSSRHEAYISGQKEVFVGRKSLIDSWIKLVKEHKSDGKIIAVVGKAGSGKSALMARFIQNYVSWNPGRGNQVIPHFIGAAPGSTNIQATLRRINIELCRRFSLQHKAAEEYKNIVPQFNELLKEVGNLCSEASGPLMIVIDGLDGLSDAHQARNMQWLPLTIPQNVLLVVSCQEGGDCVSSLMTHQPAVLPVGALDMWDKPALVRATLAKHRKELDESPFNNQMKLLTAKKEAINPFYLKLACEEMRVFGIFEKMSQKLKSLPQTVAPLLQEVLSRLEEDHGAGLVSAALGLLACSPAGLGEAELHRALSYCHALGWGDSVVFEDVVNVQLTPALMLPQNQFSRLLRAIQGLLMPGTPTIDSATLTLSHREVAGAVQRRYIKSIDVEKGRHQLLAAVYWVSGDPGRDKLWAGKQRAAFANLPYHLACGGCYKQLQDVMCSLYFLKSKCMMGLALDLPEDYLARGLTHYKSAERESQKFQNKELVKSYQRFISSNLHVLSTHPALLWQQAVNQPPGSVIEVAVRGILAQDGDRGVGVGIMEVMNKRDTDSPCVYTVSGLSELVTCLAVSRDSRRLAVGSRDCQVHLYDLDTGKETLTLTGHSDQVTSVCFVGSDKLCSASADTTLGLWDLANGHRISIMKGHSRHVGACSANGKAEYIVSAGWDRKLKVWNARKGTYEYDLRGDHGPMNCVAWHPEDSLVAVGSWDAAIRIWDVFNKTRKGILRGHSSSVRDVAYNPTGTHIASAAIDGEVKLWSATNGSQVGTLSGHALPINRLTFSPQGHQLITVSDDHKVKVWSGHLGTQLGEMGTEEDGAVVSLSLRPDGCSVAAGYHSGIVRVYDVLSGSLDYEVSPHKVSVRAIKYEESADSRLFTGADDASMKMLDGETGRVLVNFAGHNGPILSITVGGQYIVSTSEDVTACVYTLPYTFKSQTVVKPQHILTGHDGPVTSSALSPDFTTLVTASKDMSLMFWRMSDLGSPHQVIKAAHMDWINSVSWSPDNADYLVTGSNDFTLKLWDTKTYKEKIKMTGHLSAVNSVAYRCGCIVSCSCEGVVKVWTHKGTEITSLHSHTQMVNACDIWVKVTRKKAHAKTDLEASDWGTMVEEDAWLDKHAKAKISKDSYKVDDLVIGSCSDDGTVQLWKPLEGNEVCCLTGHSDRVSCVTAVTTPGTGQPPRVVTAGLDNTLKMWAPQMSESEVRLSVGHKGELSTVASVTEWRGFQEVIFTGSRDGCMKLWISPGAAPVCISSVPAAHSGAVTGICALSSAELTFASCSEDATIKIWKLVSPKQSDAIKRSVRLLRTIGHTSPLSGIHMFKKNRSIVILTTDWRGIVTVYNPLTGSVMNKNRQTRDPAWIMCSCVGPALGPDLLYCGGTGDHGQPFTVSISELLQIIQDYRTHFPALRNSYVQEEPQSCHTEHHMDPCISSVELPPHDREVVDFDVISTASEKSEPSPNYLPQIFYSGDEHLPRNKQQANWLTAVGCPPSTKGGVVAVYGDVNGQLCVMKRGTSLLRPKQVHSAAITCVAVTHSHILSASRDGTLKVWDHSLTQVGQYFAPSPITKLCVLSTEKETGEKVRVVCGDLLGDVTFLTWNSGSDRQKIEIWCEPLSAPINFDLD